MSESSATPPEHKIVRGLKEAVAYAQGDKSVGRETVVSSATGLGSEPSNSTAVELLPCPFCGGHAVRGSVDGGSSFYVACDPDEECIGEHLWRAQYSSRETAGAAWNTRATPSDHPEEQRAQMKQETLLNLLDRERLGGRLSSNATIVGDPGWGDFIWLLRKLEERLPK